MAIDTATEKGRAAPKPTCLFARVAAEDRTHQQGQGLRPVFGGPLREYILDLMGSVEMGFLFLGGGFRSFASTWIADGPIVACFPFSARPKKATFKCPPWHDVHCWRHVSNIFWRGLQCCRHDFRFQKCPNCWFVACRSAFLMLLSNVQVLLDNPT